MSRLQEVVCEFCGTTHIKTVKQVNQSIRLKGRWACAICMAGHNKLNLIGQKFGRLLVIESIPAIAQKSAWLCRCDCGTEKVCTSASLKTGHTKSCGCLLDEKRSLNTRTHGMSNTREYRTWLAIANRCMNPNQDNFQDYGGRGISRCERWSTFENFYSDMGPCPEGFSIERIDRDGNYEPGNCIWADRITQARNTRRNRMLSHNGVTKCLKAWADDLGIDQASLRERLDRWTLEEALTTPKKEIS